MPPHISHATYHAIPMRKLKGRRSYKKDRVELLTRYGMKSYREWRGQPFPPENAKQRRKSARLSW